MRSLRYAVLAVTSLIAACGGGGDVLNAASTNVPLTPSASLKGTWSTPLSVPFHYQSDFRTGNKETIGTSKWLMTWIITPVAGFTNVINVEVRYSSSPTTLIAGSAYVPLVSPTFLQGTLSSSSMVLKDSTGTIVVSGNYTTDNMALTWVHYECLIYCFGEFTDSTKLILTPAH